MIDTTETLGKIASKHPAATQVFLRHRLDFCCGGSQRLSDACETAQIDPNTVVAEIAAEEAEQPGDGWSTRPLPELIDFIVSRYHEPLRRDLPGWIEAAAKVERVHAKNPFCPQGLSAQLEQMRRELEPHLAKEEDILFPAIRAGRRGSLLQSPIRAMTKEHSDHGGHLTRMRTISHDYFAPAGACATWRALYAGLEKLEADLMAHVHLENHILFPRASSAEDVLQ